MTEHQGNYVSFPGAQSFIAFRDTELSDWRVSRVEFGVGGDTEAMTLRLIGSRTHLHDVRELVEQQRAASG